MAETSALVRPAVLLSTGCLFHLPLPVIARVGAAAGFAGLDLVMGSSKIAPGPEVFAAHTLLPVRVVHAPFRNWSAWGGHLDAWRAAARLAGELAAARLAGEFAAAQPVHVTLHPPAGTLRDAIQTRWFARAVDLPRLLDAAPGVSFSLENLPWASPLLGGGGLFAKDSLSALLNQCQDKDLGLTLDVCHLGVSGRDVLADLERIPVELVRHVHCSDADGLREHLPPGLGRLPVGPFLARLGARGYVGTVSLELDPAFLPDVVDGGGRDSEPALIRELTRLRLGVEAALAGNPPQDWAGSRETVRRNAGMGVASLG
jgi:Sugar phosphate isomerases/epimerases